MVFRKHNQTAGFSLIEVLVAITLLGLVVVPMGSALLVSFRLNARSDDVLQAQLAVSSAVETIMAEGYNPDLNPVSYQEDDTEVYGNRFDGVTIVATPVYTVSSDDTSPVLYYELTVYDSGTQYTTVETYVKPYEGGDP